MLVGTEILLTILFAGLIRGLTGFGGPLILLTTLTFVVSPRDLIPLVLLIDLAGTVALLRDAARNAEMAKVRAAMFGTVLGIPLGGALLSRIDASTLSKVVFALAIGGAAIVLVERRPKFAFGLRTLGIAGLANGVIMGLSGLAIGMTLVWFSGCESIRRARANFILWVWIAELAVLAYLLVSRNVAVPSAGEVLGALPSYVGGVFIGTHLANHAPQAMLRRCVGLTLAGVGIFGLLR